MSAHALGPHIELPAQYLREEASDGGDVAKGARDIVVARIEHIAQMFPSSCKVLLGLREVPRQKCTCERASISAHTEQ